MEKLLNVGLTGRKLIVQGVLNLILGFLLIFTGTLLPLFFFNAILRVWLVLAIIDFILRIVGYGRSSESILIMILKIGVLTFFVFSDDTPNLMIASLAIIAGLYQVLNALIALITFALYWKDGYSPRGRLLFDGILWLSIGIATILSPGEKINFQLFLIGVYLISFGQSNIRDGLFFEAEVGRNNLKRRTRVTLPLLAAALIPRSALRRINNFLLENSDVIENEYRLSKDSFENPALEIFIHVGKSGMKSVGHVDLCIDGFVYSFGSYDTLSERLFGALGDGVLFRVERNGYIPFCNREGKTLFGYGIALSSDQLNAVQDQLDHIKNMTVTWQPSDVKIAKDAHGELTEMYAYRLQRQLNAELFKFTESKFKSYFVLSTNCVLLADSIVGKAGIDILSGKGFIAPGTYLDYLDREFARPNSLVVSKSVYPADA